MLGTIERIKNNVLQKCSNLNDKVLNFELIEVIDAAIYRFSEELFSLISGFNFNFDEETLRNNINSITKKDLLKKMKRKLFIDSLAVQITNDDYIENIINGNVTINEVTLNYKNEVEKNKNSNQLNMTEDLDITGIYNNIYNYINEEIIKSISENATLVSAINNTCNNFKVDLQSKLNEINTNLDKEYLDILIEELNDTSEISVSTQNDNEEIEIEKGEENVMPDIIDDIVLDEVKDANENNQFDKYDDMTLYNKTILSLNTQEEILVRKENKLLERKNEIDKKLADTNKNIEANVERENNLSKRKLELSNREIELEAKLSELEVILLNIKPLVSGLSKINGNNTVGGAQDE